mgnify:CR=1 FL=1
MKKAKKFTLKDGQNQSVDVICCYDDEQDSVLVVRSNRQVIEDFTSKGYLNDALYAENLCSSLTARGDGKRKIAGKLRMKGIAPELIDVSSGIEARPGKKDTEKLLALCRALTEAEAGIPAGNQGSPC